MFGENYSYEKQPKVLATGDYEILLGRPFETVVTGYKVLRFPFSVPSEKQEVIPNYFDLFDCTDWNDVQKVAMFNKTASRIKACFNLKGRFCEENYSLWAGHSGKVKIDNSKSGFVNVVKFYKADLTPAEEEAL